MLDRHGKRIYYFLDGHTLPLWLILYLGKFYHTVLSYPLACAIILVLSYSYLENVMVDMTELAMAECESRDQKFQ